MWRIARVATLLATASTRGIMKDSALIAKRRLLRDASCKPGFAEQTWLPC